MEQLNKLVAGYHDLMDNKSDQRVAGPKFMENRKPFELQQVLIWYNLIQVIFSIWLFNESLMSGWFTTNSFRCQPVDYSRSPIAMRVSNT
ncbi:hypothetical protein MSG28_007609 [Choristoneura fumiferana]|uniref:Uncharacterized protein n=1 Tax=Choristoneura fumiferana TaxID=7141 RepID=A0ACC0JYL6_CHOFU|nr:hypothetical protein MSG28_007609 [Choristoneura fumiferana]